MNYLIKTDDDGFRHIYRIEGESQSHYTLTTPLFTHFGSLFHHWGRKKEITKKWLNSRKFEKMSPELASKYDTLQKHKDVGSLFG